MEYRPESPELQSGHLMERELIDRAEAIQRRVLSLRDSL
jgi:hypothetical protein